jgi:hypothetical protein
MDRYISVSVGMGNIADRRTSSGEITTLVWTVLLVLGLFVLHVRGDGSAARCMLVFGGTATLAALSGLLQARVRPQPTQTRAPVGADRAPQGPDGGRVTSAQQGRRGPRSLATTTTHRRTR